MCVILINGAYTQTYEHTLLCQISGTPREKRCGVQHHASDLYGYLSLASVHVWFSFKTSEHKCFQHADTGLQLLIQIYFNKPLLNNKHAEIASVFTATCLKLSGVQVSRIQMSNHKPVFLVSPNSSNLLKCTKSFSTCMCF